MSPEQAYKIADSIFTSPQSWRRGRFYATHDSGLRLWVSSGPAFYNMDDYENDSDFWWWLKPHRRYLHRAVKSLGEWQVEADLSKL